MHWKLLGVLLGTVVFLGAVLWGLDPGDALTAMAAADPQVVWPLLALYLASAALRTWRYQLLLRTDVPFGTLFGVVAVGFLATNVIPLRMGEFVRPTLLAERHDVALGRGIAGIVIERLLDLLGLLALLALVAFDMPDARVIVGDVDLLVAGRWAIGGTVGAGALGIALLAVVGMPVVDGLQRGIRPVLPGLADRVGRLGGSFVHGLQVLASRPADALGAVVCTAVMWWIGVAAAWVAMRAFPGLAVGMDGAAFSWAATITGMTLIPTPGFFGSFEAGAAGSLVVLGQPGDLARVYALAYHLFSFGFTVGLGLIFVVARGIDLLGSVRSSQRARESTGRA